MRLPLLSAILLAGAAAAPPEPGTGTISGRVLHALTEAPLRKAVVTLQHREFQLNAESGPEGEFAFSGLPPASYRLSAARPGFERRHIRPVVLAAGGRATGAVLRLPPQSSIAGRVIDEDGEPAGHAQVSLLRFSPRPGRGRWYRLHSMPAGENGEFRFGGLQPGRYLVEARGDRPPIQSHYGGEGAPPRVYVPVFHPNAGSSTEATPIPLGVGEGREGVDVQLARVVVPAAVTLRGRVTGQLPTSGPLQISVGLVRAPAEAGLPGGGNAIAVPPDYRFELRAPPGRYTLLANTYAGGPEAYGSESIDLRGDLGDFDLPVAPAPTVSAQLRLPQARDGELAGVTLRLFRLGWDRSVSLATSNANGRFGGDFDKPLRPGPVAVDVDPDSSPEGCYVHAVLFNGDPVSPDEFDIRQSGRLEVALQRNAATLSGRVADPDGNPVPDAGLTLLPAEGDARPRLGRAREDGGFTFSGLRPGKYLLFAWERFDQDLGLEVGLLGKYTDQAVKVELSPGSTRALPVSPIAAGEWK